MKNYLAAALLFATMSGCASEPPVTLDINYGYGGTPLLKITSKIDEVEIQEVQINRGNCSISNVHKALPYKLKFGEHLTIGAPGCQNLMEVSIATSEGSFDFTFNR
ncbi:hypothetical protein D3C84_687880 [compost metagenome]